MIVFRSFVEVSVYGILPTQLMELFKAKSSSDFRLGTTALHGWFLTWAVFKEPDSL